MSENNYTKMIKDYESSGDPFFPSYGVKLSSYANKEENKIQNGKSIDSEVLNFSIGELRVNDVGELEKYIPGYVDKVGKVKLNLSYDPLADGRGQGEHVDRVYSLDDENRFVVQTWADNSREVRETLEDMKKNLIGVFSKSYLVEFGSLDEVTISKPKSSQRELSF